MFDSVALTPSPARVGARPVVFRDGDVHAAASRSGDRFERQLLRSPEEARYGRHRGPIVVSGDEAVAQRHTTLTYARAAGGLEYRSATALDVNVARARGRHDHRPRRTSRPSSTNRPAPTRRGSCRLFDGCETDPAKVKVKLHHDWTRLIGRALRLDPWADEGLTGTVKLARVRRNTDEALEMIDDGLVGVSVGFGVARGGDEWRDQSHRRVTRAMVDHIALVGNPAYTGAQVVGVRGSSMLPVR